ncbi:DUF3850 domain-containing protein [Enterococcus faecalis]|uniref:DUF3850 domain-containing protein n=1 Tax=Enterococcus faecalis TaxID=1351 RepID=UPI000666DF9D|nr:DUF3850 domain-containing protein [Enterococcus faecalis]EHB6445327.1 DUF3850 domain-containing protein [Enterococcus faecalis]EKN1390233.1 DUF3850 domain-containing protein [Enterococcus faecalis]MBD9859479.1 DUF3850 domain-containing protein [Enterococcus faecalis]MBT9728705.1 DUF3850 domain-containing protein [Enterococcus faecalis]HAP5617735.1 DUF3850 domain-containing protein [Enterococcus faecalis]
MNKQEKEDLIQALYDIGGCDAEDEWSRGYDDGVNAAIEVVKEIKVQEKAIVPKFVAYWFEDNFEELDWELGGVLINAFNTNRSERSDFQDWLVDTTNYPIETLIRMKLFGYEVEKEPAIHELKILPEYFEAVVSGNKRFEIRKNDRNYKKGDILRLNEYQDGQYTGDVHVAEITYITDYTQQDGYVVLGIK